MYMRTCIKNRYKFMKLLVLVACGFSGPVFISVIKSYISTTLLPQTMFTLNVKVVPC